ncbi:MAG TPA: ABC transporter substrate-binding protein [Nocardioidaceae bacterium]|nr:ABC transporter substrate-binding protein [Nocardioidaceae bacterium]
MSRTSRLPSRLPGRLRRAVAGAALVGLGVLCAGCGGAATGASSGTPATRLDPALRDLLPTQVRERGVLRVGTDASYAPMSSFGSDGRTIQGVEPDLGAQIGRVLGVRVRFVVRDFTALLPELRAGDLDLVMSAMTDTTQRARTVDFVDYFSAGTAILVQRGNPDGVTDIEDLCGKVVAVERGTTQVDLLARTQRNCAGPRITVKAYPTNSDALLRLRTGRAAAVLNDLPPAAFLVNDPRTRSHYQLASTVQYEPGLYGIAVPKDRAGLRDAVKGALEELLDRRVYARVLDRWGVSGGAVDRVSVDNDR